MTDYIDSALSTIQKQINDLKTSQGKQRAKTDVVGIAYGFPISTFSNLPYAVDGQIIFSLRFISDARKSGETAGNGTGLPAFYDPASDTWLDFSGTAIVV